MVDQHSLAGLRLLDRYQLHEVLATGGLSVVYRGEDATLNRPVVVKAVPRHNAPLYREALRATGALTHPAMVVVLDALEVGDQLCVVQEYVAGPAPSLEHQLRVGLDVTRALQVALQIAQCLAYAHDHHVIHGDLTPSAILLDQDGSVHINNFHLPADPRYLDRTEHTGARLARLFGLPVAPSLASQADDPTVADVRAVGMLLWQALASAVNSGERQDFRADVTMDIRRLVARLLVREHPEALSIAFAAAQAIDEELLEIEAQREDESPTPPLLQVVRQKRQQGIRAPWAEAETLVDQPAFGPSLTPPAFRSPAQPPFASSPSYPAYGTPASGAPDSETIVSQRPYRASAVPSGARPPVTSGPLRPAPTSNPHRAPGVSGPLRPANPSGPLRTSPPSGPLRAPNPTGALGQYARSSQPGAYRPPAALPWTDEPQVAQWIAAGQSRPHGRGIQSDGVTSLRHHGMRVAPLVLIGIVLFILAFVIGYLGPPVFLPH